VAEIPKEVSQKKGTAVSPDKPKPPAKKPVACKWTVADTKAAIQQECASDTLCRKTLSGMGEKESHFDPCAKGDFKNGVYRSHGAWQIQAKLHGITISQAQDPYFAAHWTIENLKKFGYPKYYSYAISRHNGGGQAAKDYAEKVKILSIKYK
jgi:hypothetical protein